GRGGDRPHERGRRFVDEVERRTEHELAARIDRQVLDVAFQKVGLRRRLKEFGRRSECGRGGNGRQQRARGENNDTTDESDHYVPCVPVAELSTYSDATVIERVFEPVIA